MRATDWSLADENLEMFLATRHPDRVTRERFIESPAFSAQRRYDADTARLLRGIRRSRVSAHTGQGEGKTHE